MSEKEQKLLKKRFQKRMLSVQIACAIIILAGSLEIILCGLELITGFQHFWQSAALSIFFSGLSSIILGIWGITFSKKRTEQVWGNGLVVYPAKSLMALAWLEYILGLPVLVLSFFFGVAEDPYCWVFTLIAVTALFAFVSICSAYRNRMILMSDGWITVKTMFGRTRTFHVSEIRHVRPYIGGYGNILFIKASADDGRSLMHFGMGMVHADLLLEAAGGEEYKRFAKLSWLEIKEKMQLTWSSNQETWQSMHVQKIRAYFYIVLAVNCLITVFLLFFCPENWLKTKYLLLLLALQPLVYLFYIWIFRDVMVWEMPNASREWKKKHIGIFGACVHGGILYIILINPLMTRLNFLNGESTVWIMWGVLSAILWIISAVRKRQSVSSLIASAIIIAVMSLSITFAGFYAMSKTELYYKAEVTDFTESKGRYTSYYAFVNLRFEGEKRLNISSNMYRKLKDGEEAGVCECRAPLDIRFVYLIPKYNQGKE